MDMLKSINNNLLRCVTVVDLKRLENFGVRNVAWPLMDCIQLAFESLHLLAQRRLLACFYSAERPWSVQCHCKRRLARELTKIFLNLRFSGLLNRTGLVNMAQAPSLDGSFHPSFLHSQPRATRQPLLHILPNADTQTSHATTSLCCQ